MPATGAKIRPRRKQGPTSATIRIAGVFTFTFWERLRLFCGRPARWEAIATVQLAWGSHRIETARCEVDDFAGPPRLRFRP